MRYFLGLMMALGPISAQAAGGGVGEGFGADDWIAKWPVLAIVLLLVVAVTAWFTAKIWARARDEEDLK